MRKPVAPVLAMALVIGTSVLAGCTITVRGRAGATTEPAASPPPPAPPRPQQPPPPPPPPPPQNNPPMVGSVQVRPHRNIRVVNNKVQLPGPIVFDPGTANLRPESDAVLEVVLDYMNQEKQVNLLRIEGHTDSDGYPATNMDLSKERAMAVAKWLVAHGVDCKRLLPVGFGQTMPIADNNTIEGKAQNRRVDFVVASEKGKPITDSNGKPLPVDGGGQGQVAGDPCH